MIRLGGTWIKASIMSVATKRSRRRSRTGASSGIRSPEKSDLFVCHEVEMADGREGVLDSIHHS